MRVVSKADAMQELSSLLREIKTGPIVISDGQEELGALISMEDYEVIRRTKGKEFLSAADELGEQMRARAAEDGLTPEDLMKFLDRKAS